MSNERLLFALYLLVGPGAWLVLLAGLALAHSRMKRLLERSYPAPDPTPAATIVIPVKDEAERIRDCIAAVLSQDYPNFSVIAIDDRSIDGTGAILDDLAASSNERLKVLHVPADGLPDGWTGKPNALHIGSQHADGQWLLFVDSDVIVKPNLLSELVGISVKRNYDAVSLLTRLECHTLWEKLVLPVAAGAWGVMNTISWTNDDRVKVALANGQVFLIRREPYDKVGGHAGVRHKMLEDIALMRALKFGGFTTRFLHGHHLAATRMYSSIAQTFRGWGRIYATTNDRRPWRILASILFLLVSTFSICAAFACGIGGHWQWLGAALLHLSLGVIYLSVVYHLSGNRWWYSVFLPFTTLVMFALLLHSLALCWTGRITWRGTSYKYRPRATT